jgi:hypothetical protein
MNFEERKRQERNDRVRLVLMLFAIGAFAFTVYEYVALIYVGRHFGSAESLRDIPYIEPTKAALAQKTETSKALFQSSLLVVGVLWTLVIAKKGEAKLLLGDKPEMVMFFIACIIIGASWWGHSEYLDTLTAISANPIPPMTDKDDVLILDFRNEAYNNYLTFQTRVWIAGLCVSALTLFSAHVLRKPPDDAA